MYIKKYVVIPFHCSSIAEVYPTEESNPVFTTTINFYSDTAAEEVTYGFDFTGYNFKFNVSRCKKIFLLS